MHVCQDLEDVFDEVDVDRSGRVSVQEVFNYICYDDDELYVCDYDPES